MADLIIKPLLGAGNTVRIQDQAGGAILTSENSGATIGGGVTIPAAGITGVLPVGVTGGSGLDAVPATAGQVINFECKSAASTGSEAITSTTVYQDSGKGAVTYTVVSPTSKIFVQWNCHFQVENDAANYKLSGTLRSDVDSYASNLGANTGGSQPLFVNYSSPAIYLWLQMTMPVIAFHDHNQSAGTTISYKIYFTGLVGSIYSWDTWGNDVRENVTFIEVEQ